MALACARGIDKLGGQGVTLHLVNRPADDLATPHVEDRVQVPEPAEHGCAATTAAGGHRTRRLPWAELLRRVFADDVLRCPCGGRRSVVAIIIVPAIARAVLAGLGLPAEPATFAPARAPPQTELCFDEASQRLEAIVLGAGPLAPTLPKRELAYAAGSCSRS